MRPVDLHLGLAKEAPAHLEAFSALYRPRWYGHCSLVAPAAEEHLDSGQDTHTVTVDVTWVLCQMSRKRQRRVVFTPSLNLRLTDGVDTDLRLHDTFGPEL
jgi:hypothetical protein